MTGAAGVRRGTERSGDSVRPGRFCRAASATSLVEHWPSTLLVEAYPAAVDHIAHWARRVARGLVRTGWSPAFIRLTAPNALPPAGDVEHHTCCAGHPPALVEAANAFEAVVVLHALDGLSGADGARLVGFLSDRSRPIITAIHSVPEDPNDDQCRIIDEISIASDVIVVQSERTWARLVDRHDLSPRRLAVVDREAEVGTRLRRLIDAAIWSQPSLLVAPRRTR